MSLCSLSKGSEAKESSDTASSNASPFVLPEIEAALSVPPPPLLSCHPLRPLLEACQLLMKTHARRLPLLDYDEQTGIETVVSVLTQYRILKFIAMNVSVPASETLPGSSRRC